MRLRRWAGVCVVVVFAVALGQAWAACGNAVIEAGEECDDGSTQNGGFNSCCQSNCLLNGSKAPDVIVGELVGTSRYGNIGGVTAYSVGTTSCNLGSCWLNWFNQGTSPEHPVIGQNMFRLKDGRFEQIGQAWLKHGYTALQQSTCASCTAAPNGTHLGVNCSDPYDSGLNGTQSRLGPKEDVNPNTGIFPFPDARIGLTGDVIYKRLQVHDTDLNPTLNAGAVYFVEGQYVTRDDAASKNQSNNASYRSVTVGAAPNFSLTLTGTTQRQKAGIEAWKATDATVTQTSIKGSDGTFLLAAKVTSLGGGLYHYEYAVQNLNNHRAGQSFTVPIQPGTTVTNVGFHDVDYHSGEPFSGTDWTPTVTATSVRWETTPYATNVNANALRWGTLYNFRFDANVAPGTSAISIDLFKPGASPSPLTANVPVPGPCFGGADGTGCNDFNVCTQSDACSSGVCTGSPAANGTPCNDANACTQTDTCSSGACVGANPVSCTAQDSCHNVGTCQPATGTCTNPVKADGSPCTDGNACTQTDACVSGACLGGNPVTCAAQDSCHDAGTCQAATGTCTNPAKADGAPCSDGNACTQTDACTSGSCVGSNPVSCFAADQCHDVGTCQAGTGTCSNPEKPDGTTCDDASACTTDDACTGGVCAGVGPQVPQEVGDGVTLSHANNLTTLAWTAASGSTYSSVLRGLLSQFPVGPGGVDEYCLEVSTLGTTTTDGDDPAPGEGFWYLVRGVNDCGSGSYGSDWQNAIASPRQSTTCP